MKSLLSLVISAGLGLWIASMYIAGVVVILNPDSNFFGIKLIETWQLFVLFGITLGLLNFFVKPILNVITLPLRILTLGIFGFLINMFLIWMVDYIFVEFSIPWFVPLFWTTLIIWLIHFLLNKFILKEKH